MTGPSVTLIASLEAGTSVTDFAVGEDGTFFYVLSAGTPGMAELVWVARDGAVTLADPDWHADFESVSIDPGGGRVAAGVRTPSGAEVWIGQMGGGPRSRLPVDGTINYRPTWAPDGRVVFVSNADGQRGLTAKRADGIGAAVTLDMEPRPISTGLVSPDGQWQMIRTDATELGNGDILVRRTGDSVLIPLVATSAGERHPTLSPDGRWLAYRLSENQSNEIWVRPFPNVEEGRWQVSIAGGSEPVWAPNGRELFYINNVNELVSATVQTDSVFEVLDREILFRLPEGIRRSISVTTYDVSRDGSRFLMIRSAGGAVESQARGLEGVATRLILVENWFEELGRLSGNE